MKEIEDTEIGLKGWAAAPLLIPNGKLTPTKAKGRAKAKDKESMKNNTILLKDVVGTFRINERDLSKIVKKAKETLKEYRTLLGCIDEATEMHKTGIEKIDGLGSNLTEFLRDFEISSGNPKQLKELKASSEKYEDYVHALLQNFKGVTADFVSSVATIDRIKDAQFQPAVGSTTAAPKKKHVKGLFSLHSRSSHRNRLWPFFRPYTLSRGSAASAVAINPDRFD